MQPLLLCFVLPTLPGAPSAFAVASARTRWRGHLGPSDGDGAKGRTPSVEPEPRLRPGYAASSFFRGGPPIA